MKYISTIIILFTILNGCTSEKLSEQKLKQVIITGKEYATFEEKESRNDISGQLEENSIISFYSRGGISAENIPLTYTHGVWNYTSELQWNTDQSDAVVSAYYPYMENDNFTVYEPDGKLKDILYYTGNTRYGSPIILKFSHLFSQLVFHVDPLLNKQLQEIQFTPSVSVHTFDPFLLKWNTQKSTLIPKYLQNKKMVYIRCLFLQLQRYG